MRRRTLVLATALIWTWLLWGWLTPIPLSHIVTPEQWRHTG
jgi:hypothetical protein